MGVKVETRVEGIADSLVSKRAVALHAASERSLYLPRYASTYCLEPALTCQLSGRLDHHDPRFSPHPSRFSTIGLLPLRVMIHITSSSPLFTS